MTIRTNKQKYLRFAYFREGLTRVLGNNRRVEHRIEQGENCIVCTLHYHEVVKIYVNRTVFNTCGYYTKTTFAFMNEVNDAQRTNIGRMGEKDGCIYAYQYPITVMAPVGEPFVYEHNVEHPITDVQVDEKGAMTAFKGPHDVRVDGRFVDNISVGHIGYWGFSTLKQLGINYVLEGDYETIRKLSHGALKTPTRRARMTAALIEGKITLRGIVA